MYNFARFENLKKYMKRSIILLSLLLPTAVLFSQGRIDSLVVKQGNLSENLPDSLMEWTVPFGVDSDINKLQKSDIELKSDLELVGEDKVITGPFTEKTEKQVEIPKFPIVKRGDSLPQWGTGYLYGSHQYAGNMMYGYIASVNMGVVQNLGDYFTVTGGVSLNKYSVFYNTATFNGSVTWHPNRYFSVTAFGAYMPGSFLSPINIGQEFVWGGYASVQTDTDVPFGIDLGARDYYGTFSGHEVVPIVQPYIKLGGSKLGFDFGPMIKNAIDKANGHNGIGGGFSPIPKPMKVVPPVAPRR